MDIAAGRWTDGDYLYIDDDDDGDEEHFVTLQIARAWSRDPTRHRHDEMAIAMAVRSLFDKQALP